MKVLEVGDMVGPNQRIVSLRWLKSRGWKATDSTGARYYQTGPGHGSQGPSFALGLVTTQGLAVWPEAPADAALRKGLRQRSAKKDRELRESRPVVAAVMARDGGCVLRRHQHLTGDCFGEETPHHLLKASAGGKYEARNCVDLCEHHQSFVEDYPADARRLGLVVTRTIPLTEAWSRMRAAGLAVGPQDLGGEA